jgi:hypothetical protein
MLRTAASRGVGKFGLRQLNLPFSATIIDVMCHLRSSLVFAVFGLAALLYAQSTNTILLRGHQQQLKIYGTRGTGDPVIISSGDGGWIHLAPHVAQFLASKGFFVT